jgi:Txe/YoeB family toxin of Txe-Axe toxin-antitoxin module
MQYEEKPGFFRSIKRIPKDRKVKIKEAIYRLVIFFETGQRPVGLGLRQIRNDYWEIRVTIKDRVIFRLSKDKVEFLLAGSHDDIKIFLKNL